MKSTLPKVLHPLLGRPLLAHVIDIVRDGGINDVVVVIGHGAEQVREAFRDTGIKFVEQSQQLGTGHAVACAETAINEDFDNILILCGDTPLFRPETINELIQRHETNQNKLSLLTAKFADPTGYGRIVRSPDGAFRKVVEEKDASRKEKAISEVNTGTYLVDRSLLFELVKLLRADNAQGEYYLTDIVELAVDRNERVEAYCLATEEEALGVNSRRQLAQAEGILLCRIRHKFMDAGVTLSLPETIYIEPEVDIGRDVFIGPHTIIKSGTRIGEYATIHGHCYISGAVIEPGVTVEPFTVLKG